MHSTYFREQCVNGVADMEVEGYKEQVEISVDHPDSNFRIHYYPDVAQLDRLIAALQKAREEINK